MKTKYQFFKENFIVSIIWNIPVLFLILIPLSDFLDTFYLILEGVAILLALSINSMDKWYLEERLEDLNKRIKQLENKQL